MNLSDLTEVLRDHARPSDTLVNARLAGVRAKVVASRRRRAVAGAACVVLALVGAVFAVLPRAGQSSEPALHVRTFPEYQEGTRLIAQAWGDLPSSRVELRFVPKTLNLRFFIRCHVDPGPSVRTKLEVDGNEFLVGCHSSGAVEDWSSMGLAVGKPVVLTLTVDDHAVDYSGPNPATVAVPTSGTFGVGVGEPVPLGDYRFPPRPETLVPIPPPSVEPVASVSADPADPNARQEFTAAWSGADYLRVQANTPGRMRVLVNDVQVLDYSKWDYELGESQAMSPNVWPTQFGLVFAKGDPVRITVLPERFTGDWEVRLGGY